MDPQFLQPISGSYPNIIPEVPESLWLQALKHGKIRGELGPVDFSLGMKDLQAQAQLGDIMSRLKLNHDGNGLLNIQKPMMGGLLSLDAAHNDDGNNYMLQFRKNF